VPHNTLKHFISVGLFRVVDNSRAVDQVNTLSQRYILPHFCLSRNRSDLTYYFLHQSVNHRGLSDVGITNESDGNALLVSVKLVKLFEQLDQGAFTKWIF